MIHIVTHGTDPSKLVYLNAPVKNLATRPWNGFKDKLYAMREFLVTLPPTDVVCFVDGYDVTCFGEQAEVLETFKKSGVDVLFSAETSCYPWIHVQQLYPTTVSLYRYLNSGGYIGYVSALLKVLSCDINACPCDQGYMTYYYLNNIHDKAATFTIELDRRCVIFQTAYGIPWSHFLMKDGRLYNKVTNTYPCFLHYNGQQFLMKGGSSIMPIVYGLAKDRVTKELGDYEKFHEVICNEEGIPFTDMDRSKSIPKGQGQGQGHTQGQGQGQTDARSMAQTPVVAAQGCRDADIIALATERARRYVPPHQEKIVMRDEVNYHAVMKGSRFISGVTGKTMHVGFAETNREVICSFMRQICMNPTTLIDISLHDFVGTQMNTREWPHSILSFSTSKKDTHNLLIPDLYAMQDYKGALNTNKKDNLPTNKKVNKMLFIGVSSGKASYEENNRVAMCQYAVGKDWIEAYLSGIVNFSPRVSENLKKFLHAPMTQDEQYVYRHILVIDGNTACWDRLPWVLASNCVCWKEESTDECWYYEFLKPWVHYVPFTRETLHETWLRVKDDMELQERLVRAANEFVEDFLRRERHVLYMQTLMDQIGALSVSKGI